MCYTSNGMIGYAISDDGVDWERPLAEPVLAPGASSLHLDVNYGYDWVGETMKLGTPSGSQSQMAAGR